MTQLTNNGILWREIGGCCWCWWNKEFVYLTLSPSPGHPSIPGSHLWTPIPPLLMLMCRLVYSPSARVTSRKYIPPDWPDGPKDRPNPLGPRSHPVTHIVSLTYPAWKSNYLNKLLRQWKCRSSLYECSNTVLYIFGWNCFDFEFCVGISCKLYGGCVSCAYLYLFVVITSMFSWLEHTAASNPFGSR